MDSKWTLKGEAAKIDIYVSGYERPAAENQSDANWLRCKGTVLIGRFSCSGDYSMMTSEFAEFEKTLKAGIERLSGVVSFSTIEGGLGWDIEFNSRGQATISGFVKSVGSPKAELRFSFQSDQSYLQQTLSELVTVNRQFPIRAAQA